MKAQDVVVAVRRHYGCEGDGDGPEWAALTEFTLQPGAYLQRIDLMMVRAWSGRPKGHERHAIEVKVSRSDLLKEFAHPEKRAPFEAVAHRFFFATPAGLVRDGELPPGCGLLEVGERGVACTVRPPRREPAPMPEAAFVEAFRRSSRAEARIRDASRDDPTARVAFLERQVDAYARSAANHDVALDRERSRVRALLAFLGDLTDAYCVCGGLLTAGTKGTWPYVQWRHAKATASLDCWMANLDIDRLADALVTVRERSAELDV